MPLNFKTALYVFKLTLSFFICYLLDLSQKKYIRFFNMENNIKKILHSFVAYCIVCNGHSLTFDFHITSCTQCESVCNTSKRENYALYSKIFRRKERRYSLLRQHFGTEQSRRLKSTRHRRLYRSFY